MDAEFGKSEGNDIILFRLWAGEVMGVVVERKLRSSTLRVFKLD